MRLVKKGVHHLCTNTKNSLEAFRAMVETDSRKQQVNSYMSASNCRDVDACGKLKSPIVTEQFDLIAKNACTFRYYYLLYTRPKENQSMGKVEVYVRTGPVDTAANCAANLRSRVVAPCSATPPASAAAATTGDGGGRDTAPVGAVADCPRQHGLTHHSSSMEGYDPSSQWECDDCRAAIEAGGSMYGCRECPDGGYDICEACYGSLDVMRPDSEFTFPLHELVNQIKGDDAEGKENDSNDDRGNDGPKKVIYQALSTGGHASRAVAAMVPLTDTTRGEGEGTKDDPVKVLPYVIHLDDSKPFYIVLTPVVSAADLVERIEALGRPGAYGLISLADRADTSRKEAMGHTLNFYHTKGGVCFIDAKLPAAKDRVITGADHFQHHLDTIYAGEAYKCQTDTFFFCICGGVPLEAVVTTTHAPPEPQDSDKVKVESEPDKVKA